MKDKSHRQRIEEEMVVKNPAFDRFMKIGVLVCITFSFLTLLLLIVTIATVFNILS